MQLHKRNKYIIFYSPVLWRNTFKKRVMALMIGDLIIFPLYLCLLHHYVAMCFINSYRIPYVFQRVPCQTIFLNTRHFIFFFTPLENLSLVWRLHLNLR